MPPSITSWVPPLRSLTIHCTVGAGDPLAAAVKLALPPALTAEAIGFVVTVGAAPLTVNTAALVVSAPWEFVNTASYWFPLRLAVAPVIVRVVVVAPL